jgi:hypothetical protein
MGLSLVNSTPEELVYISLRNIQVDMISKQSSVTVEASVKDIQVSECNIG